MTLNISNLELAGKNIVIVEDDIPSIKYYETLLRNTGADIITFRTGKDFVDHLAAGNSHFDLIFMDFLVPLINGIECTRILRKGNRTIPVIMITGYSSEQARREAFIAGCNEYILKPVYPENIILLLEKYLLTETRVQSVY